MVTIQSATSEMLDEIWAMVQRAVRHMNDLGNPQWGEDYPTRAFYAGDIARGELYAAMGQGGTLLGVACINQEEAPEYGAIPWSVPGPAMVIHRMAVDPLAQRQGVGHAFFGYAEALARGRGLRSMRLDTYGQNDRMQRLMERCGFRQVGEISLHGRPLMFPCFEKIV